MAKQIGIIADDFTGANDTGVRLAQKGLRTKVLLTDSADAGGFGDERIDVWIVDTDSRSMAAGDAYQAVYQEMMRFKTKDITRFYKKVDSTLRGPVAAELQAMKDAGGMDMIWIAPAFPAMGRTVEQGILYVNGVEVAGTEFAKDPKTPVLKSFIPDLLEAGSVKAAVLTREILFGADAAKWVQEQFQRGVEWLVCDAVSEADFAELAMLEKTVALTIGWAGSAGMINHLYTELSTGESHVRQQITAEKVLVAAGSLSGQTSGQLAALKNRKATIMAQADPLELLESPARAIAAMQLQLAEDGWDAAVIYVDGSEENRSRVKQWAAGKERSAAECGKGIAEGLGLLAEAALEQFDFDAIIMTGGDTAKAICNNLAIHDVELKFEVEPGLPLGFVDWNNKKMAAITKAGGFGTSHSLVDAVDYLRGAGLHASV